MPKIKNSKPERTSRTCSECNKSHSYVVRRLDGVSWIVDARGARWGSKMCPPCYKTLNPKVKVVKKEDDDLGPSKPLYPPKLRPCQKCKKLSPNYFNCKACLRLVSPEESYESDFLTMYEVA